MSHGQGANVRTSEWPPTTSDYLKYASARAAPAAVSAAAAAGRRRGRGRDS
jgi:hypothetical protein